MTIKRRSNYSDTKKDVNEPNSIKKKKKNNNKTPLGTKRVTINPKNMTPSDTNKSVVNTRRMTQSQLHAAITHPDTPDVPVFGDPFGENPHVDEDPPKSLFRVTGGVIMGPPPGGLNEMLRDLYFEQNPLPPLIDPTDTNKGKSVAKSKKKKQGRELLQLEDYDMV